MTPGPAARTTMTMPFSQEFFGPARTEARCLTRLVEHGTSPESVRNLITVSPQMDAQLRRDAERHPREANHFLDMIAWRKQVLAEFDELLQEQGAFIRLWVGRVCAVGRDKAG